MTDYSTETALWPARVRAIQEALRLKLYVTALAEIAYLRSSLIAVDAWVQNQQDSAATRERG